MPNVSKNNQTKEKSLNSKQTGSRNQIYSLIIFGRNEWKRKGETSFKHTFTKDGCKENAERTRDARWDELKRRSVNPLNERSDHEVGNFFAH